MVECLVYRGGRDGLDVRVGWGRVRMTRDWNGRVCGRVCGQMWRRVCKDVATKEQDYEGEPENYHVAHFGRRRSIGYTTKALPSVAQDPFTCTL